MLSNEPVSFQVCMLVLVLCWVRVIAIIARRTFEPKVDRSNIFVSNLVPIKEQDIGYYHYSFPGPEPRTFEAGVTDIVAPYEPRWSGETFQATGETEAILHFYRIGFHRNLVVREVLEIQASNERYYFDYPNSPRKSTKSEPVR